MYVQLPYLLLLVYDAALEMDIDMTVGSCDSHGLVVSVSTAVYTIT
jgi:hypothetical protein